MLALIIDLGGAYLIAQHVKKLWLQIVFAFLTGVVSPVITNLLLHLIAPDMFRAGDTFASIIVGMVWHPLVAIVALYFFRRKLAKPAYKAPSAL